MRVVLSALAANGVLVLHAIIVFFAIFGALLVLMDWRFALVHLPIVLWSSLVNLASWTCPLTPLEQRLRLRAGQASFQGGWIQHYFEPIVRPLGMPRRMELIAGFSVLLWNIVIYAVLYLFDA